MFYCTSVNCYSSIKILHIWDCICLGITTYYTYTSTCTYQKLMMSGLFSYFRHSHPTPREHLQLSAIPEGHCKYSLPQRILIMIEQELKAWAYTEIYRLQPCQTPEFIGEYISFSAF